MDSQFLSAIVFLLIFSLLVFISHILYRSLKTPAEHSRKFLHVTGGLLALFFPHYIRSHWWILVLCAAAFLLLLITYIKKFLPGIHQTKRFSFGSIFFPIPVYICFLAAAKLENHILFFLPISLLTISDTMAEWGGKKWGASTISFFNGQKTLAGFLCFATSCFLISITWLGILFQLPVNRAVWLSVCLTVIVSGIELISLRGFDNLSVPLSALLILMLLLQ